MNTGITIKLGASVDTVTFRDRLTGASRTVDRTELRKAHKHDALKALTFEVQEETEVLKDRDKRRNRRIMAERGRARAALIAERSPTRH